LVVQLDLFTTLEGHTIIETEEWRMVPDFPRYDASTMGRIRNRGTGRYMTLKRARDGYLHIGLTKDGTPHEKLVHRIIAQTWLENPSPEMGLVNHKNRERHDNRIINLEWCTRSYNAKHAHAKRT
jgi:HNH endonuclease/NUMOD4 motif